jgi:phage tail-like protein
MSRGLVPGLVNPHPLGEQLPAVFHGDELAQRLTAALDEVLAPVVSTLDNLDAYVDPDLTPDDFLPWLAGWLGLELDQRWSSAQARAVVAHAVGLFGRRGTLRGLEQIVALRTGGRVSVRDSGGVSWSRTPGAALPGDPVPSVSVTVTGVPDGPPEVVRIRRIVAAEVPAHVPFTVQVTAGAPPPPVRGDVGDGERG